MMTVTPGIVTVTKSQDSIAVRCSKEGYNDGTALIASNLEGMSAGNLILGGVIGVGVDAASGALNKYAPQVDVILTPLASKRNK